MKHAVCSPREAKHRHKYSWGMTLDWNHWTVCADTMHVSRVAREDAERQLAADRATAEGMRTDWQRKLEERRKEAG
jgi:hypothetical protein